MSMVTNYLNVKLLTQVTFLTNREASENSLSYLKVDLEKESLLSVVVSIVLVNSHCDDMIFGGPVGKNAVQ